MLRPLAKLIIGIIGISGFIGISSIISIIDIFFVIHNYFVILHLENYEKTIVTHAHLRLSATVLYAESSLSGG